MKNDCRIKIAFVVIFSQVLVSCGVRGNVRLIHEIQYPRNVSCCKEEPFQHYYRINSEEVQLWNNTWLTTKAGETGTLRDVCLQENGLPVTRRCFYNEFTKSGEWESLSNWTEVHCLQHTRERIVTAQLNTLQMEIDDTVDVVHNQERVRKIADQVSDLLVQPDVTLLPADVFMVGEIMKPLVEDAVRDVQITPNLVQVMNTLMTADATVLRLSAEVNATNAVLDNFETYMDAMSTEFVAEPECRQPAATRNAKRNASLSVDEFDDARMGVHAELAQKLSVFFVNPTCANVSGIALYYNESRSQWPLLQGPHFRYRFLYMNQSKAELLEEPGLLAATFVPETSWREVEKLFDNSFEMPLLVFKVYYNDVLFVERGRKLNSKPYSKILSITIPGFSGTFPGTLPFILRNNHANSSVPLSDSIHSGCAYWNYNTWSSSGVHTESTTGGEANNLVLCSTDHLTQFGFLVGGNYYQNDLSADVRISPVVQQSLDIISLVGCTLSLLGLLGIWLTAALFPKWRVNVQIKVLLNLCVALTLQMVLFLFINTDHMAEYLVENKDSIWGCVMLGALMQYSILVLFAWMLSVAYLQFQRFVTVLGDTRPPHYVLKSALVAWLVPLVPTLICAFVAPQSYIPTAYQLHTDSGVCYPSGNTLFYGVILPISLLAMTNLGIFVYVAYSVSSSMKTPMQRTERKLLLNQVRLYVLLFFVLGLPWIFGLMAFMGMSIVFSYLFCLTATVQGFVLFIYYVIFNEIARREWRRLLHLKVKKTYSTNSREKQSIVTTTTT